MSESMMLSTSVVYRVPSRRISGMAARRRANPAGGVTSVPTGPPGAMLPSSSSISLMAWMTVRPPSPPVGVRVAIVRVEVDSPGVPSHAWSRSSPLLVVSGVSPSN